MQSATFLSPAPHLPIPEISNGSHCVSIAHAPPVHSLILRDRQPLRHSSRSASMAAHAHDGTKSPRILVSEAEELGHDKKGAGAGAPRRAGAASVTRPASMQTDFATAAPLFSSPALLSPANDEHPPPRRRHPPKDPASLPPLPPQAAAAPVSPAVAAADDDDLLLPPTAMHVRSIRSLLPPSTDPSPTASAVPGFTPLDTGSPFIHAIRKAQKKRRGSVGEGTLRRQKALSAPVEPRLTKSSTYVHHHQRRYRPLSAATAPPMPPLSPLRPHQEEEGDDGASASWDPHIDAFEVLRAKITGITRTMQELHVQELFRDELTERNNNSSSSSSSRQRHHTVAITARRMSTSADPVVLEAKSYPHHRRIRSHDDDFDSNAINNSPPPPPPPAPNYDNREPSDPWGHLRTDEDFEDDLRSQRLGSFSDDDLDGGAGCAGDVSLPTSPNLTALFLTTNSLISSRLDELSETASIASSCGEDVASASWRPQFLDLVSACITQSEELESLSTELLGTERRVRELLVLNGTVNEQYHEREKVYEERIRECEEVAKQQLYMIDTLEELMADLDMKLAHHDANTDTDSGIEEDHDRADDDDQRWDFKRAVADILGVESQGDLVHKMRWEVGMFVGGGVGTGHVIHSFEGRLRGIEMMIAGSGATVEDLSAPLENDGHQHPHARPDETTQTHISRSLPRTKFHHHHYMLHISARDRKTRFRMIPRAHWVPDQMAAQCQFAGGRPCSTRFNFFQRRHHCRRCGIVVCQRHSGNRLPLFAKRNSPPLWSRVCDNCFCNLIMTGDKAAADDQ